MGRGGGWKVGGGGGYEGGDRGEEWPEPEE